jgi:hypothetical protein
MGLLIDISKIEENLKEAVYGFSTPEGNSGKVSIHKDDGECFIIEEPSWDKESTLAIRALIKIKQHWRKGEFPDITCWAS